MLSNALPLPQDATYERAVSLVALFYAAIDEQLHSLLFFEPPGEEQQPTPSASHKQPIAGLPNTPTVNYEHALHGFHKDQMYAVYAPDYVDMSSDEE
ncbi:hypothetical protein NDU88_007118 [Pleurodeles waltl]|uniref:Uncharacterized protein n=1 Tax=Pleurodeles waltl TaxID=8319 RepID=A0AAV7NU19_PLEWA|nr:hypothetical protein NDU88_007118 [Pleurodeles waltl]